MSSPFLLALNCRNDSKRVPIWLMRQAGRYMASYRALREQYSFLELCHNPDLIAKVTLLPIDQFRFDAAILFSDILVIPEALGVGLHFEESKGPIIHRPVQNQQDIDALPAPDISRLQFVKTGIENIKSQSAIPLIGFCGAPFTVASYMIEGGSSRDLKKTKKWMYTHPVLFHQLLKLIADWSIAYLKMQIAAGVQAIQIFDSWANFLAYPQFQEFSKAYLKYILKAIDTQIPVILFCKGSSIFAEDLASIQPAAISFDWNVDITRMRKRIPYPIALQGNLDPDVLYGPLESIKKEALRILQGLQGDRGFIFNLGHGLLPDIPEKSVAYLVELVQKFNN